MEREPTEHSKDGIVTEVIDKLDREVEGTIIGVDRMMHPIRQSAFRRLPTLFMLLVTLGFVATLLGMEKLLEQYDILNRYPWAMLTFGVAILVLTGRLHKKLD